METMNGPIKTQEIVDLIPNLKNKVVETTKEYLNYKEVLQFEKIEEIPNEKEEETIKRAESIYDRLDEMVKRREIALNNGKEAIDLINNIKLEMEKIVEDCENEEIQLVEKNNEIIDGILSLEERKMNKEVEPLQNQINLIKQRFDNKKNEWNSQKMDLWKIKRKKEKEETKKKQKQEREFNLVSTEMKQIEEWTQLKCGKVIFDSENDNWSKDISVFNQRVINKSNLIFVIEDTEGNKFGGYVNEKIDKINEYIIDSKAFLFSLKSNGRILKYQKTHNKLNENCSTVVKSIAFKDNFSFNSFGIEGLGSKQEIEMEVMMKFDTTYSSKAFCLGSHKDFYDCLFLFGYNQDAQVRGGPKCDIEVGKEDSRYGRCVQKTTYYNSPQTSFDYKGIENALCGSESFGIKRITVIQLI